MLVEADEPNIRFVEVETLLGKPLLEVASSSVVEAEVGGEVGFDSMSLCSP